MAGVSHFLEHMVFKGTPRRDALAVNRDFDRVGAKHNAQTSEEDTFYHVTCLPEYLPQGLRRPVRHPPAQPARRRLRDREEGDHRGDPDVPGQPDDRSPTRPPRPRTSARTRSGRASWARVESITDLEVDAMRAYFAARYSPSNIVLAFAGNIGWDEAVGLAERHCGSWTGEGATRHATPPRGSGSFQTILRAEDQQQTVIGVADGPPLESDDRYAAQLLANVLGDHTGSRLYWDLIDPGHADGVERLVPGLQPGGRVLHLPELRARRGAGQPRPARRRLPRRGPGRDHRRRADAGQEQGPLPLRPPRRAPDGPPLVARLPLGLSPRVPLRRR